MKKSELLDKLEGIASHIDNAESNLDELRDDLRNIKSLLEDIPTEANEIEEDEEVKE